MKKILLAISALCGLLISAHSADQLVLNTLDSGPGSLRNAIANASSGDNIFFDINDTIRLTSGEILIDKSLNINPGSGSYFIISGEENSRIFTIQSGTTLNLNIEGITFTKALLSGSSPRGGAVFINASGVSFTDCDFINNACVPSSGASFGGAVVVSQWQSASFTGCSFKGNSLVNGHAAAVGVDGQATFDRCLFAENYAESIAWIYGGAVAVWNKTGASATITNSTFSGNAIKPASTQEGYGAAVAVIGAQLYMTNCTITENNIEDGQDLGGGIFVNTGNVSFTLQNSIVSGNTYKTTTASDINFYNSSLTSEGNNIIGVKAGNLGSYPNASSDIITTSPGLGALQINDEGRIETHGFDCSAPAYQNGATVSLTTDQNGNTRSFNGATDIGAYEYQGPLPLVNTQFTNVTCFGANDGTATVIKPRPNFSYEWSTTATTSQITGLAPGQYVVTATNTTTTCQNADTVIIEGPQEILVQASIGNATCNGESDGEIALVISGGVQPLEFDWNNDGTGDFDDVQDQALLMAGSYDVVVQDANGCTAQGSYTVTEPAALSLTATVMDDNGGNSGAIDLTVSGGTAGYTYQWDNPSMSTTQDLMNLSVGTYEVVVSDANSCKEAAFFTVNSIITGWEENAADFRISPNPAQEDITLISDHTLRSYTIRDMTGQVRGQGDESRISLIQLLPGAYVLQVMWEDQRITTKTFIKE